MQDYAALNLDAGRGVAIRGFPLSMGSTDSLLIVDRQTVGVIKAKKVGETLIGVEAQSAKYRKGTRAMGSAHGPRALALCL